MSSGVKVNGQCTVEFEKLKMKKEYRYIIFKLSDNLKEIVVDETSPRDATYDDMQNKLFALAEQGHCRYAVYDLDFEVAGQKKDKIVFIAWNPEGAKMKPKMVYTSSKDYLKKALQIEVEAQCTDADELSLENITEKASKNVRN